LAAILLLIKLKTHFMKKIVLSLFLSFAVFSVFNLLAPNAISEPTGSPASNTGSPADGTTCAESCHGGSAVTQAGLITSNIPTAGYTPGTTYTITATISGTGKKGFQVSPQNTSGTLLGSLIAGSGNKIVGTKYVTHSSAKTTSTATWTFQWIAPAAGTGAVTFYGAFAITTSTTKKSTLQVNEAVVMSSPTITSFTPTNAAAGATVTISGTGFTGATAVSFGGTAATSFTVVNATTIQAVVGSGASGDVIVTNPSGSANKAGFVFVIPPTINQFTPISAKSGETVTILGSNFTNATSVKFGGVVSKSFTVQNDNLITAVVAAGASGDVTVVTPNGTVSLAGFTFLKSIKIKSFAPDSAKTNDTITIVGENLSEVIDVTFGGTAASSFSVLNDTMIVAAVGAGSTGDVGISDKFGSVYANGFVYLAIPTIGSFSPTTARRDEVVTIYGNELIDVSNVLFGGVAANSFNVISNTQIEAHVGNGNSGNVTVVAPNGSDTKPGFIFNTSIGIENQSNAISLLNAYPNPAKDQIQIKLPRNSANSEITIFNILGERVFNQEIEKDNESITISLNNWKAGSYLIRWNDHNGTITCTFVKTN
jgi:hypothetical protein